MFTGQIQTAASLAGVSIQATVARSDTGQLSQELTLPVALPGTLDQRTADYQGRIGLPSGHGFVVNDVIDIYWPTGIQRSAIVQAVGTTYADFASGLGDTLPVLTAAVTVARQTAIACEFEGDNARLIVAQSSQRSLLGFRASDASTILAVELKPAEDWRWVLGVGSNNLLAGRHVKELRASCADTTNAALLKIGVLYASTGGTPSSVPETRSMTKLEDDTAPKLGGNLNLNSKSIIVGATTITAAQVGYLSSLTSAIQTQLNAKLNTSGGTASGTNVHADSQGTVGSGTAIHSDSAGSVSSGQRNHADSEGTITSGTSCHADSLGRVNGYGSHADSYGTVGPSYVSYYSHADSMGQVDAYFCHADSYGVVSVAGYYAHAHSGGLADAEHASAENCGYAYLRYSHVEGAEGSPQATSGRQRTDVSLVGSTTQTNQWLQLLLTGSTASITPRINGVWLVRAQIVGVNSVQGVCAWSLQFVVRNSSGTLQIVSQIRASTSATYSTGQTIPADATLAADFPGWVRVQITSGLLDISVENTGAGSTRWHADLHLTEITGGNDGGGYGS